MPRPVIQSVTSSTKPVLTVEMATKWYHLVVVHPDGWLDRVDFPDYDHRLPAGESSVGDHCVNPLAAVFLANDNEWLVDPVALEVMIGRWETEHKSKSEYHRCLELMG